MANPQAEDGHTDIANEIVHALARTRISGTEVQLLWVIFRKTYGWHKKEDAIALSQFHEMTLLSKPHIIRYLKKLLHKKIIVVAQNGNGITTYQFNKDFETWQPLPKKATLPKKAKSVAQKGNKSLPKKGPTKETSTKETTKEKYGEHVRLSVTEYQSLIQKYGEESAKGYIEALDIIIGQNVSKYHRDYKDDYKVILNRVRNGWLKAKPEGERW